MLIIVPPDVLLLQQVVPGGETFDASNGYRLRFDGEICVKLPSNVYVAFPIPLRFVFVSLRNAGQIRCDVLGFWI